MAERYSTATRNGMLDSRGLKEQFTNCWGEAFTGTQPASADDAPATTYLGMITLNGNAFTPGSPTNGLNFAAPSNGTMAKDNTEVWQLNPVANGTIGWIRLHNNNADDNSFSTTKERIDMAFGVTTGEIRGSTTTATIGVKVTIDGFNVVSSNP